MTDPRRLVFLNGLAALACVLHVLVHATGLAVGAWHDYVLYVLVAAAFAASVLHARRAPAPEPVTA